MLVVTGSDRWKLAWSRCGDATTRRWAIVVKASDVGLLLDCVRMGALMEQVIRNAVAHKASNDTGVWILVVLSGRLETPPIERPEPMNAESIAARLGFVRGRVSMRIAKLMTDELVRAAPESDFPDGRTKAYLLTRKGSRLATQFHGALILLEQEIRYVAGIKSNARAVDPQRLALALSTLAPSRVSKPSGLDRRRTAGVPRA